ncbi:DUF4190 domain-containing protein [Nocardia sp. X0981]
MTNPGESDEWWKQYGGSGISSDPGASAAQPPPAEPSSYPSAPQYPSTPAASPVPPATPSYSAQPPAAPYPAAPYGSTPGYPAGYQPYGYPANRGTNGLAIASLVTSLAGFATCGFTSIVGIILGVVALNQIRSTGQEGRGLALGGIWVGVGLVVLLVLYLVVLIGAGIASAS